MTNLVIESWVGHNEKAWFSKLSLNLIGEHAGSVAASNGNSSSVVCKLQHSTLREREHKVAKNSSNTDLSSWNGWKGNRYRGVGKDEK